MLVAGIFTLVPVLVDEATLLMNMGSYMSYALRFGFLNALYFLGGACLAANEVVYSPEKAFDGTALNKKNREGATLLYAVACLIVAAVLSCFVSSDAYLNLWDSFISDSTMLNNAHAFSGMFAHSLGGLQVVAVLFVFVAFVTLLGVAMVRNKEIGARVMAVMLIGVVAVQVLFYNEQLVVGNRSTHYNINHYKTMVEQLNERDDSYFRVKDYEDKLTADIPFTGNSNSFSVFSSVIDADNFEIVNLFGYWGNGRNSMKSSGGNVFGDAFLGYKYFFVSSDRKDSVGNLSYISPVEMKDENGNIIKDENGKISTLNAGAFYMYESNIVFPLGYTVESGEFRFAAENTANNRAQNQMALYKFLGGTKDATSVSTDMVKGLSKDLKERAADVKVGAGEITAEVTAKEGECLFLNFVASKGYKVTVNGKKAELIDNDLHFLSVKLEEGENVVRFTYSSPYIKYFIVGLAASIASLLIVALIVRKTRFMKVASSVIAWAGVSLAIGVVLFFMLFPTGIGVWKLLNALWGGLRKLWIKFLALI